MDAESMSCCTSRAWIGDTEIDMHRYEEIQVVHNVTVHILKCTKCGHIEILWERSDESYEE